MPRYPFAHIYCLRRCVHVSFVRWITGCTDVLMFSVWFLHFFLKVMTALMIAVINVNTYQEMTLSNLTQYWDQMTPNQWLWLAWLGFEFGRRSLPNDPFHFSEWLCCYKHCRIDRDVTENFSLWEHTYGGNIRMLAKVSWGRVQKRRLFVQD